MADEEYWKRHARRHEKKLRRIQTAAFAAVERLGQLAEEFDQISDELDKALRGTDDRE